MNKQFKKYSTKFATLLTSTFLLLASAPVVSAFEDTTLDEINQTEEQQPEIDQNEMDSVEESNVETKETEETEETEDDNPEVSTFNLDLAQASEPTFIVNDIYEGAETISGIASPIQYGDDVEIIRPETVTVFYPSSTGETAERSVRVNEDGSWSVINSFLSSHLVDGVTVQIDYDDGVTIFEYHIPVLPMEETPDEPEPVPVPEPDPVPEPEPEPIPEPSPEPSPEEDSDIATENPVTEDNQDSTETSNIESNENAGNIPEENISQINEESPTNNITQNQTSSNDIVPRVEAGENNLQESANSDELEVLPETGEEDNLDLLGFASITAGLSLMVIGKTKKEQA